MEFVVNDTNIFVDLVNTDLLDAFFQLEITVYTTDFVIAEIEDPVQAEIVERFVAEKKLIVDSFTLDELEALTLLQDANNGLSIEDCSVWYYSKQNDFTLITGDGLLRKCASNDRVKVKGVLFIFDALVGNELITPNIAAEKLELLLAMGSRLPQNEYDKRLGNWRS
jgi:hypothetical protein